MNLFKTLIAFFRLNDKIICEMSNGKKDYHDYKDSTMEVSWHFYNHTCKRCGKQFTI